MESLEFLSGLLEYEKIDNCPEHVYWPKGNEDAEYVLLEYVDALLGLMKSQDSLSGLMENGNSSPQLADYHLFDILANDNFLPCQLRDQLTEG
jgi:hypothetical protein